MALNTIVKRWFVEPPVVGGWAPICAIGAIAAPTLIRLAAPHGLPGSAFGPYLPFVLLTALFVGWRYTAGVIVLSVALSDLLFFGPRYELLNGPSEDVGIALFLVSSALIVAVIEMARRMLREFTELHDPASSARGVIFSLERGQAWASWYGTNCPVRLGSREEVAAMMKDFLAQLEVGERLQRSSRTRSVLMFGRPPTERKND